MQPATFRVRLRGLSIDTTAEHAASFGLNHLGTALGLPRVDWAPRGAVIVGSPDGETACAAWAAALGEHATVIEEAGVPTIQVRGA